MPMKLLTLLQQLNMPRQLLVLFQALFPHMLKQLRRVLGQVLAVGQQFSQTHFRLRSCCINFIRCSSSVGSRCISC